MYYQKLSVVIHVQCTCKPTDSHCLEAEVVVEEEEEEEEVVVVETVIL